MKITLKLFATLSDYLPTHAYANEVEIEVGDGTTPHEILDELNVPRKMVHLVLLNGIYVDATQRDKPVLEPGDALAIWPPVAGG